MNKLYDYEESFLVYNNPPEKIYEITIKWLKQNQFRIIKKQKNVIILANRIRTISGPRPNIKHFWIKLEEITNGIKIIIQVDGGKGGKDKYRYMDQILHYFTYLYKVTNNVEYELIKQNLYTEEYKEYLKEKGKIILF